jgi:UDP-N-acetyl-2-amino-2-deoxyglucuronate dehydrogenase
MNTPDLVPLKLAVIGAGLGSAPHFRSLADLVGEAEVVWVLGRDLARMQAANLPAGAHATTQEDDVFNDPNVDAVLILTPPDTHLHFARLAARAGKHVLVEKPLETRIDLARELVETCESAGVLLAVMLQHRLREGALELARLLQSGALGEIVSAGAFVRWWRPQSYYDVPGRGTLARDGGGVLMTQAIHTLDLLLTFTGMPVRVSGSVSTSAVHHMECEDTANALLRFDNGATALVQATTAAFPGYPERIEINGTRGTATLTSGELRVRLMDGAEIQVGGGGGNGGGADPMAFDHGAHRAVIADFLQAIREGREPKVSGRSALGVMRAIEAVLASARADGAPQAV